MLNFGASNLGSGGARAPGRPPGSAPDFRRVKSLVPGAGDIESLKLGTN